MRRQGVRWLSLVLLVTLGACSRIVAVGGGVGLVPPPVDGGGPVDMREPDGGRRGPLGGSGGPANYGSVRGRITAGEGSTYDYVMVELFHAFPDRVVHRERVQVNDSYQIAYDRSLVHCQTLAVRFTTPDGRARVRELGGCGQHSVNHEIPPGG